MAQVFVVVGPGNVISFIIREIGDPALVGWIIQVGLRIQVFMILADIDRDLFSCRPFCPLLLAVYPTSLIDDISLLSRR